MQSASQLISMFESMNPQVASNPMFQNLKSMIANGDSAGIERMAKNLCSSMGTSPERMAEMARRQLNL